VGFVDGPGVSEVEPDELLGSDDYCGAGNRCTLSLQIVVPVFSNRERGSDDTGAPSDLAPTPLPLGPLAQ